MEKITVRDWLGQKVSKDVFQPTAGCSGAYLSPTYVGSTNRRKSTVQSGLSKMKDYIS
jgi:hypothetical protein